MKKILLIDDDETFIKTVNQFLTELGYKVIEARDGREGLEVVGEERPDLILLDLMMPNLGGIDFLKLLQKDKESNKIPVLISSNFSSIDKVNEGIVYGVRGYIVKSNESLKTISNAVESIIGKAKK
ncbi:MAG: response regulator [Minisyncoccia bacterium]